MNFMKEGIFIGWNNKNLKETPNNFTVYMHINKINKKKNEIIEIHKAKAKFKIYQCDVDNNIINEFNSCTEAGKVLHIDRHDISDCVKGKRTTAGGFVWKKVS